MIIIPSVTVTEYFLGLYFMYLLLPVEQQFCESDWLKYTIASSVCIVPFHFNFLYSFYSEPLFCSLGIAPFVTAIVIGVLSLCGGIFITLFIEKVQK